MIFQTDVLIDIGRLEEKRKDMIDRLPEKHLLSRLRVRRMVGGILRNSRIQLLRKGLLDKKYANIGAGGNILRGFINIDYSWTRGLDLCWDITRKLPLRSGSLKGVFSEHTLEHLVWSDAMQTMLPEAYRILEPGGTIRISVPDAEKAVKEYVEQASSGQTAQPWRQEYDGGNRISMTPMLQLNNTFRRIYEPLWMGHKFAYDFQTLEYFLHLTGFAEIKRAEYMSGRDENLLVDYQKRASESLYVEAVKPSATSPISK